MGGALEGIKVLDFTRFQQGTFSTALLGDQGADVLKVEQPGGDPGRTLGMHTDRYSSYFESLNRNKRSIVLDLRKPEARAVVERLAAKVDVVVENFRRGVMDRLGIGYEALRSRNPRIIYASGSMFGPRGPRSEEPGYDNIAQAAGGMIMATWDGTGTPHAPQGGLADQVGGMLLSHGILAALVARELHGVGQRVDASLYGSQIALQGIHLSRALYNGRPMPPGAGSGALSHRAFCADGVWIAFGYLTGNFWPNLCRALDLDWLTTDARFADQVERGKHQHDLVEIVDAQVAIRPSGEWIERLIAADVPCTVVQDYHMIGADPQALENEYVISYHHPTHGQVHANGFPVAMSEMQPALRYPAPLYPGFHSEEILREAGFDDAEVAGLIACGAVESAAEPAGVRREA